MNESKKIPIGISSCLLGEEVRFNGGHKHQAYLTEHLGAYFDYFALCPEVGIGMPIPRPAIRLISSDNAIIATNSDTQDQDYTEQLKEYAKQQQVNIAELSGYIFMQNSPSCGLHRVKVYDAPNRPPEKVGRGIFAQQVVSANPLLPVEDAGRLNDPGLRDSFVTRVMVYHQWRQLEDTKQALLNFHSQQKYLLLAHSPNHYRHLGQLLSNLRAAPLSEIKSTYISLLMEGLADSIKPGRMANALTHMLGYFKQTTSASERASIMKQIELYRKQIVPLIVPITLLRHLLSQEATADAYLSAQSVLAPYPDELSLRNQL